MIVFIQYTVVTIIYILKFHSIIVTFGPVLSTQNLSGANRRARGEGAVAALGIGLNIEEWATLRNVVMTTSDEALQERVSKGGGGLPN